MIPLATIVAFDIGGILGGAVITETVFEWNGDGHACSSTACATSTRTR